MWRRTSTRRGERTLGVMPLYHTMGVRSLLAMSLIGGTFVCLPRFRRRRGAGDDRTRADHQSLPGADAVSRPAGHPAISPTTDVSSVRKLGFAGAPMTDGLLQRLNAAFQPDLFVNHYGSSEVYTCTIEPACATKARLRRQAPA